MVKAKRIFCVIAYDIKEDKIRSKIAKLLEKYGIRVNNSVFECMFTNAQYAKIHLQIELLINKHEDSIVYYPICVNCFTKIVYQPKHLKTVETILII